MTSRKRADALAEDQRRSRLHSSLRSYTFHSIADSTTLRNGFHRATSNASEDLLRCSFEACILDQAVKLPLQIYLSRLEKDRSECICSRCCSRLDASSCFPCQWQTINS